MRVRHEGKRARAQLDLGRLNPEQRDAVLHDAGPMLVLAGAGSGKTRVITYRIARLLADGTAPEEVLGVTFTNKAATEMRQRLTALAGRPAARVHLSTFHALGLAILREEYAAAGLQRGFCIYDTSDQLGLVRELMRQIKVADRRLDASKILHIILRTKRERRDAVPIDWGDDYELAAYDLYPRYLEQMAAFNAIDFDDLMLKALDVLQQPDVRRRWRSRFRYLLVDEYQDTSPDQLELVRALSEGTGNVCVVGDDDQAIYAWRGAAVDNILAFNRHFPGTKEVVLARNYRSTENILACANAIIENNAERKAKTLWSGLGAGEPVEIVTCVDGEDEVQFVADRIGQLIFEKVPPENIAVLYRANTQARAFEEVFRLERIPYRVVGGQSFFDRKEVRDAAAFLAVAHNPRDEIALRRIVNVPARGIGPTSLQRLAAWGEQHRVGLWGALRQAHAVDGLPPRAAAGAQQFIDAFTPHAERLRKAAPGDAAPAARALFEGLGLRDAILSADDPPDVARRRMDNLEAVAAGLERFERKLPRDAAPLEEYMRSAALNRDGPESEQEEVPAGQVTLMTLHSAKGLEFPYVFMVGMEEDLLPHKRTVEMGGSLNEERRLCYVGMTRAQRRLWVTHAARRKRHGKMEERTPSRFLQELPDSAAVYRWSRAQAGSQEDNDAMAAAFFAQMREQLGLDDEPG